MRNPALAALMLCVIVSFTSMASAASISGMIYDSEANPLRGAIVALERGGSLMGQAVTNDSGSYSFQDLESDRYVIIVSGVQGNQTIRTGAALNLSGPNDAKVDFVLIESLTVAPIDLITGIEETQFASPQPTEPAKADYMPIAAAVVVVLAAALIVIYIAQRKQTRQLRKEIEALSAKKEEPTMGRFLTDEEKVYQIVQRRKEVPQRDIVIETDFSKAKVSLILRKLEQIGKVRRTTVGRVKLVRFVE